MRKGTSGPDRPFFGTRAGIAVTVFLLAAGFLLLFEHQAHIPGDYYLLGLILAFCVGIHLFMHGGHGGHGGHSPADTPPSGHHGAHDQTTDTASKKTASRYAANDRPGNDRGVR